MSILDDIQAAIDRVRGRLPIQYYATADWLAPGRALLFAETDDHPQIVVLHPDELPAARAELRNYCRLIEFSTWQPSATTVHEGFCAAVEAVRTKQEG